MYSKFFDYEGRCSTTCTWTSIPPRRVGRLGKPESYYFPPQLNNHLGDVPGHLLRLRSGRDEGAGARAAAAVRERRQPHHRALPRLPHRAGHRLVHAAGRRPRAGLGADLRAAVEQRRELGLREHRLRRGLPVRVPGGELPGGQEARPRLRHEPDGLGEERRSALQEDVLPPAGYVRPQATAGRRSGLPTPTITSAPRN